MMNTKPDTNTDNDVPTTPGGVETQAEEVKTPLDRMRRRRSTQLESSLREQETEVDDSIVGVAIGDMRKYLAKNFAPKHSKYFEKRFKSIITEYSRLQEQTKQVNTLAEKMERMEGTMRSFSRHDWCKKIVSEVIENIHKVGKGVISEVDKRLEGMSAESVKEKMQSAMESVVSKVANERRVTVERMEPEEPKESEWAKVVKRRRRGPRVIVEVPGDKAFEERREEVARCLDPKGGEVRVKSLRRKGKDVVVEVADKSDVDKMNVNERLKECGMKVKGMEGWRDPRVKIFDVTTEVDRKDLRECIRRRNQEFFTGMSEEEISRPLIPEFSIKRANGLCDWVVRMSPRMFSRAMMIGRLFVGMRVCRMIEFVNVRRCGKCHRFGHTGAWCGAATVCGHCGVEGHHAPRCDKGGRPNKAKCINCVRYGYQDTSHQAYWQGSPVQ